MRIFHPLFFAMAGVVAFLDLSPQELLLAYSCFFPQELLFAYLLQPDLAGAACVCLVAGFLAAEDLEAADDLLK